MNAKDWATSKSWWRINEKNKKYLLWSPSHRFTAATGGSSKETNRWTTTLKRLLPSQEGRRWIRAYLRAFHDPRIKEKCLAFRWPWKSAGALPKLRDSHFQVQLNKNCVSFNIFHVWSCFECNWSDGRNVLTRYPLLRMTFWTLSTQFWHHVSYFHNVSNAPGGKHEAQPYLYQVNYGCKEIKLNRFGTNKSNTHRIEEISSFVNWSDEQINLTRWVEYISFDLVTIIQHYS